MGVTPEHNAALIPTGDAGDDPNPFPLASSVVWVYAVVGAVWIVLSDLVVAGIAGDESDPTTDIVKGLVFVAVTSALLWIVLRRLARTHRERLLAEVTTQRDLYEGILQTASDPIVIFGLDGHVRWANEAITDALGFTQDEIIGRRGREFIDERDRASAIGYLTNAAAGAASGTTSRMFRLRDRDDACRTMSVRASPLVVDGELEVVVVTARDVTERSRRDEQLHALLAGDVTGLPGLASFIAEIEWLDALVRPGETGLLVVLADIERFGTLNEVFGREGGDIVLHEVARRFEAALPEAVGWWRHGPDAFLAVLVEPVDGPDIDRRALVDRLRAEAAAPIVVDGDDRATVDVAVGVAQLTVPDDRPLATEILGAAEEALRAARDHPDRFSIDQPVASTAAGRRARTVTELHDALARDELVVHFQPKVDLRDGSVVGSEALVRWRHPSRGVLSPAAFLWAADFANLTAEVTHHVLRRSLETVARWRATAAGRHHTVAVNITVDELRREHFCDEVLAILREMGVPPSALVLEITEQALLTDLEPTVDAIAQLRANGIGFAIDDFGTGYSSLAHLRHLSVDELKIDRSFVAGLQRGISDDVIVSSVIGLGSGLGVRVTAEGIEEPAALSRLRDLGCDYGQGYLFSPAVPAERFPHQLAAVASG